MRAFPWVQPLLRIVAGLLILSLTFFIAFATPLTHPPAAQALTLGIPYGGLNTFQVFCTCSFNTLLLIFDYATKSPLLLVYQPGVSRLYLYFNIFGRYLLGDYMPGAGQCYMFAGPTCVPFFSHGMLGFGPGTGTSL